MLISIPVSPEKERLLGATIVKALRLKPDKNGDYTWAGCKVCESGLGQSVLLTVEETIENTEEKLQEWLDTPYP